MRECLFCKIQKKKDKKFITENKKFFSIYDNFPVTKGHCLIVPKRHIRSFFDLSKKEILAAFELIKKLKEIIQKQFKPDGFNVGVNEGKAAGRTIDHLHIHLIPRYKGDVKNPIGGVRNVILGKGDYSKILRKKIKNS